MGQNEERYVVYSHHVVNTCDALTSHSIKGKLISQRDMKVTRIKSCSQGTHFTSVEKFKTKTENLLKGLPKSSFQNCYQQWQHLMHKFVNAQGNYFEGDVVTKN
ncbi:hypothetical protein TNCV_2263761 [Trichonephila clavipes]|nr:hypothetical protein TNCV_2263761 [Trichonephila clavipes]